MVDGQAIARYRNVEVTVRVHRDGDSFDVAWRTDVPSEAGTAIGSMAGVRRALGLPTHPVVTLGRTGRRTSRVHILRPGWYATADCGVGLCGDPVEGSPREVTCRRCRAIWRQR